jgi:very-short-patch-repair endonuclease
MNRKNILPYNPILKDLARDLRNNSTFSEVLLWRHLKSRQMLGYDFDRQKPIDHFIVDFFCNELMLAIEIDGESHDYKIRRDRERQKLIEGMGVQFLRFTDEEVKQNIEGVVAMIENWIREKGSGTLGR